MNKKTEFMEQELDLLGFEFLDLGTDFDSKNHLYYVLPNGSGTPIGNCILEKEGIEILLSRMKDKS